MDVFQFLQKRRRYLSHRIYELQEIIAANHDHVARPQMGLSSNLVDTLLADANLVSSKFALLLSTVFNLAASPQFREGSKMLD